MTQKSCGASDFKPFLKSNCKMSVKRRKFNAHDKRIVAARQKWRCAHCNELLDETFHIDHIIPLHMGGPDTLENAQALCVVDHAKKTVREESERLRRLSNVVHSNKRPPLVCTACRTVISPYFIDSHSCWTRVTRKEGVMVACNIGRH